MFNTKILSSIIQENSLKDEQAAELRKVIRSGASRTFAQKLKQVDDFSILFLCNGNKCSDCSADRDECKHTPDIRYSKNYGAVSHINLKRDFDITVSGQTVIFTEKER